MVTLVVKGDSSPLLTTCSTDLLSEISQSGLSQAMEIPYNYDYVNTKKFDNDCHAISIEITRGNPLSPDSPVAYNLNLSDESSGKSVSELEAALYYCGVSGRRHGSHPKLIYRTSKDVFTLPIGPEAYRRLMTLEPVFEHDQLGQNDKWATVRSQVRDLCGQRSIKLSSIDLVRFHWMEQDKFEYMKYTPYTTPITIWVGVLPDTLTGEVAFDSANDILSMLQQHGITDLDVAYRESVYQPSTGPTLYEYVWDNNPLVHVIHSLTTSLGLPIAGYKTLNMHGTLGFYFKAGDNLYGVTARHVLFSGDHGNDDYIYTSGPRKDVILMGTNAFKNFLRSIQAQISDCNSDVDDMEQQIEMYTARAQGEGEAARKAADYLEKSQRELVNTKAGVVELKKLFVKVKKEWSQPADRVIGHVVWSPGISVAAAPHNYTLDVAVILLDKTKFLPNFQGNVLELGKELDLGKFNKYMHPRVGAPSDFKHPFQRQFKLQGMVSENDIPVTKDRNGDLCRYVIKNGLGTTHTTIGRATGFESFVRRYFANDGGTRDSVEAAIFRYDNDSGPFASGGDSGSVIVDAHGQFFALLTGGTGKREASDITFGTPMHWLWQVIQDQFPGANLEEFFD